ncbi:hypothetical protein IE990_15380 [Klebsiella pneumoniae]|uniref:Uncharacterized protein n=1 Tax=Klebsiella pneumoniae TaxID=573 RepID=A0A927DFN1_KLEPN|nr:hypothetical protein [Klebsiella pneumoniae]
MSRGGLPSDPRPATVSRGTICWPRRAGSAGGRQQLSSSPGQLAFGCQPAADSAAAGAGERTRDPLPGVAQ